jgi:hypothetical protein
MTHLMTFDESIQAALTLLADSATTYRAEWGDILYSLLSDGTYQNGWQKDIPTARNKIHVACLEIPRPL